MKAKFIKMGIAVLGTILTIAAEFIDVNKDRASKKETPEEENSEEATEEIKEF